MAIVPALVVLALASSGPPPAPGEPDPADERLLQMLVLSQVVLGFQLPFAIIPLVQLTSDRRRMGAFASGRRLQALSWASAFVVVAMGAATIWLRTRLQVTLRSPSVNVAELTTCALAPCGSVRASLTAA